MCIGTCVEERQRPRAHPHCGLGARQRARRERQLRKINDRTRTRERLNVRPMSINIDAGPTKTFDEIGEGFARDRQRYPRANTGQCWTVGIMGDIVVGLIWALLPRVYKLQYRGHLYPWPLPLLSFLFASLAPFCQRTRCRIAYLEKNELVSAKDDFLAGKRMFVDRWETSFWFFLWKLKVRVLLVDVTNEEDYFGEFCR